MSLNGRLSGSSANVRRHVSTATKPVARVPYHEGDVT